MVKCSDTFSYCIFLFGAFINAYPLTPAAALRLHCRQAGVLAGFIFAFRFHFISHNYFPYRPTLH
jgi:hypothetical protein